MPQHVDSADGGVWDPQFRQHAGRYIGQCALATISIGAIMLVLDAFLHAAIITSLGATTFIVFALPRSYSARWRSLLGGYGWGMLAGLICHVAAGLPWLVEALPGPVGTIVWGACATGLATLLMVATNTEHPPAAGLALGLVVQPWDMRALLFVSGAVVLLSFVRHALRHTLINLA